MIGIISILVSNIKLPIIAVIGRAINGKNENSRTQPITANNTFSTMKLTFNAIEINIKNRKIPTKVSITTSPTSLFDYIIYMIALIFIN